MKCGADLEGLGERLTRSGAGRPNTTARHCVRTPGTGRHTPTRLCIHTLTRRCTHASAHCHTGSASRRVDPAPVQSRVQKLDHLLFSNPNTHSSFFGGHISGPGIHHILTKARHFQLSLLDHNKSENIQGAISGSLQSPHIQDAGGGALCLD